MPGRQYEFAGLDPRIRSAEGRAARSAAPRGTNWPPARGGRRDGGGLAAGPFENWLDAVAAPALPARTNNPASRPISLIGFAARGQRAGSDFGRAACEQAALDPTFRTVCSGPHGKHDRIWGTIIAEYCCTFGSSLWTSIDVAVPLVVSIAVVGRAVCVVAAHHRHVHLVKNRA